MERERDPGEEPAPTGAEPTEDTSSPAEELTIVRNLADEYAVGGPPVWVPPPPPKKKEASPPPEVELEPEPGPEPPAAEPEPAEPEPRERRIQVDWDRELGPPKAPRRPAPAPPAPPAPPRPSAPASRSRKRAPGTPRVLTGATIAGGAIFVIGTTLSALRLEPFHTWYYLFAWYPFLLAINWWTAKIRPEHSVLARPARPIILLMLWSVPIWLFFELWNFRLGDWYYVGVPPHLLARRIGVIASFATVLPGILFFEEAFRVRRVFDSVRTPAFALGPRLAKALLVTGGTWAFLMLAWPATFFPLLWGVPVLCLEPWLARGGDPSLLRELADGRPGRILRLLVAGLGCGLFWEAANSLAGGKWIYTVPGLETSKLFEMPVAGFVGFAPFALSCWVMARALVRLELLPEWELPTRRTAAPPPAVGPLGIRGRAIAAGSVVVLSLFVLWGMDGLTVDSFAPRPEDIPGLPEGIVDYARDHGKSDVRGVLAMAEAGEFYIPGESSTQAIDQLAGLARLVLLRGIGTENARRLHLAGVQTVGQLAAREPEELMAALEDLDEPGWRPRERRVRVWIAAARRELE